jgi:hypothetical protein
MAALEHLVAERDDAHGREPHRATGGCSALSASSRRPTGELAGAPSITTTWPPISSIRPAGASPDMPITPTRSRPAGEAMHLATSSVMSRTPPCPWGHEQRDEPHAAMPVGPRAAW